MSSEAANQARRGRGYSADSPAEEGGSSAASRV